MTRSLFKRVLIGTALATFIAAPPYADAIIIITNNVAIDTSVGIVNPLSITGFNPQPEPPDPTALVDLSDPQHPRFAWSNSADHYQIIFGIENGADIVTFETPQSMPDGAGNYAFSFMLQGPAYPGGSESFDVFFDISTVGALDSVSWILFNPQPEPPIPHVAFEFNVTPASATSVDLGIQIFNPSTATFGSFTIIPEPSTFALAAFGLLSLSLYAWRRRGRRTI